MDNHAKGDQLRGFEYVRAIALDPAFFTVENGLLTPTFKLKRSDAAEKFRPLIDALYKELELSAKARGINPKL